MHEDLIEGGIDTEARKAHMSHIYENLSLTFNELIKIFTLATQGFPNIEVTEKLDGQNIAITYDPQTKKALALRNKGHVKLGGLNVQQIISFFTSDREQKALKKLLKDGVPEDEAREKARTARLDLKKDNETGEVVTDHEGMGVVNAFRDAMHNFEEVAETFPEHFFITADGCRIFYNAEVLDPRSRNVVDYDTQTLALHRVGHLVVCPDSDKAQAVENAGELSRKLQDVISMMQTQSHTAERDEIPTVEFNAIMDMTSHVASLKRPDGQIKEPGILIQAKEHINRVMSSAGLSLTNTLHDFLRARLASDEQVSYWLPEVAENNEIKAAFIDALIFFATTGKTPRINTEIKAVLQHAGNQEQLQQDIQKILRNPKELKNLVRRAYGSIEHIVHVFSSGLLEGLQSYYTIGKAYERNILKLRSKYGAHVKGIMSSGNVGNIDAIKTHVRKILHQEEEIDELTDNHILQSVKGLTSAVEGLVFDYNGHTYKLTGQFAPMNQILGIGRFERGAGKRDEFDEILAPERHPAVGAPTGERLIAVWPGGFKPPHAGHFYGALELIKKIEKEYRQKVTKMYILIGNVPRAGHSTDRTIRITADVSKHIWDLYFDGVSLDTQVQIVALQKSPITWIYDRLDDKTFKDGDVLFLGHGEKDSSQRFVGIDRHIKKLGVDVGVEIKPVPLMSGGISGTEMRNMAASEVDFNVLERVIPSHVSEEFKQKIYLCMTDPENCFRNNQLQESIITNHLFLLLDEVTKHHGFQKRLKRRLKKQHKKLLDQGRHDLIKYGKPFTKPRVTKSNAFLAKEGLRIKIPGTTEPIPHEVEDAPCCGDELEEIEVVDEVSGVGGISGFAGPFIKEED